jgi:primosomal protein N' (replication factor Y) (superfamily II helicase)
MPPTGDEPVGLFDLPAVSAASKEFVRPPGRVVRVLPDVAGIDKAFDYVVPVAWDRPGDERGELVRVGSLARIDLHGRRVGGWVLDDGVEPPEGIGLRPLAKVSGLGPPREIIELARYAAWRWCGRLSQVLTTASPPTVVRPSPTVDAASTTPIPIAAASIGDAGHTRDDVFVAGDPCVVRLAPADDAYTIVAAATRRGNALILAPSVGDARLVAARLRRSGVRVAQYPREWSVALSGATVVGARAAAFAPVRDLAAIVVIDEHAESYREERMPTWHARDVAIERAHRAGIPCVLTSPSPTLDALAVAREVTPSRAVERAGWPIVDIVDRRRDRHGPGGLFSDRIVEAIRGEGPVVCVLNRTGRSTLLACGACGELARCEHCKAAVTQNDDRLLVCSQCGLERPAVCASCGAQQMKNLRLGVTRAQEELEALAQRSVIVLTSTTTGEAPVGPLYLGTETALHQLRHARVVIFLDFDQELLAPRYRGAEQAMGLLVRAARLVGARADGGRIIVQTRLPKHEVLDAALHADPGRLVRAEQAKRQLLELPPYRALAMISGAVAPAFVARLGATVQVLGPNDGRYLVRATDAAVLADALAGAERPTGRLRIEVDPDRA